MTDPFVGVHVWASILSIRSLALILALIALLFGSTLWRNREWWLWVFPRPVRQGIRSLDDQALARWWRRVRLLGWLILLALAASWLSLARHVVQRP